MEIHPNVTYVFVRVALNLTILALRLQNSRFFLKISKENGKAWRKSLTRAKGASLSPVSLSVFSLIPDLLFDCSRVLAFFEYAKTDCFAVYLALYLQHFLSVE